MVEEIGIEVETETVAEDVDAAEERSTPSIKTPEDAKQLVKLADRITRGFEVALRADEAQLSVSQWAFLDTLAAEESSRPFAVANKLGITRQNAAQTIKKLKGLGFVTVSKVNDDSRAVFVEITDAGKASLARAETELGSIADALNEQMPKIRTFHTKKLLRVVAKSLKPAT